MRAKVIHLFETADTDPILDSSEEDSGDSEESGDFQDSQEFQESVDLLSSLELGEGEGEGSDEDFTPSMMNNKQRKMLPILLHPVSFVFHTPLRALSPMAHNLPHSQCGAFLSPRHRWPTCP